MERGLQVSFWKTVSYSCYLTIGVAVLGVLWKPTHWLAIGLGSSLGTSASLLATYLLYRSSAQMLNLNEEAAVEAQLKSYGLRFAIYILAIVIVVFTKAYVDPLFTIIGFLIPKVAIVIEAYIFNRQTRR